ncbi:MAG: YggS family pyridoxal phosphate-dependent enzyme, partial [Chloroflexota bacterium]|nr:YggS family pyridoxal phosphate-dependent enzyme [Chloroflexota bacterium]
MSDIEKNLRQVQERIETAAARAGREPREIMLVAVSKTFPAEAILAAHALGVRHFGENRVEEAAQKIPPLKRQLQTSITWHLVGHLQSRKVKDAAALFDFVQSVDSVALARRLSERAALVGKTLPILLEVNVSGEVSKYGFSPALREELFAAVREILALPHLDTQGLMTVAPIVAHADAARPFFRALREARDELRARFPERAWQHLSMGMTDDFEAAIAEGATIVR